jgi:beta-N-acetylhexosaminidase
VLKHCGFGIAVALAVAGCQAQSDRGRLRDEQAAQIASKARAERRAVLGLSPERAAARLMLVGFPGTGADAPITRRLRERDYGGVVLGAGNYTDDAQLAALVDAIAAAARRAHHAPPVVFADRLPVALRTLHAAHVGATFGPVADLAITGGPHERDAFSDDPRATARVVERAVAIRSAARVASAVGHFPGEGSAAGDPELEPAPVGQSLQALRDADLVPFRRVIHKVSAVQMSNALYAAFDGVTPATELPQAVALLRGLDFHGVVVSGDLTVTAVVGGDSVAAAAVAALRAGCDLLYIPGDAAAQEGAYRAILGAIRRGTVPAGRVKAALRRVSLLQRSHA